MQVRQRNGFEASRRFLTSLVGAMVTVDHLDASAPGGTDIWGDPRSPIRIRHTGTLVAVGADASLTLRQDAGDVTICGPMISDVS